MPKNERLQQLRIRRNWRQRDVANELGVAVLTIHRWEQGTQQPSAYYRTKLCALFGVSSQELGLLEIPSPSSADLENAHMTQPEIVPPEETVAIWTVPYARNPHFTGRDTLFALLEQQFSTQKPDQQTEIRQVALTQAQVIKGLGGIGKTQIAVEYAYRAREQARYIHTLWINSASEEAILSSFVALAELLPAELPQKETDQRKLVAALIRWLERCDSPWLLIFDNADDLSPVHPYIPLQGRGHILLTTRANAVSSLTSSVEVGSMDLMEGVQFLLRRAQRETMASDDEIEEATSIIIALAQFPLAIDQAGAYIEETRCSFHDYFQIYQKHRYALLARRGMQATRYPESVATTWSLSLRQIEEANPASIELLHLCAFLAPDHIPEELLTEGATYWPPALQEAVTDRFTFNQMVQALLAFSLVKRLASDRLLSIHRLVQAVQVDRMTPEEQRSWAERIVRTVHALFPSNPQDVATWAKCQRYLAQVEACEALIQRYRLCSSQAAEILDRAGVYHREKASYQAAEPLLAQALSLREQLAGPSDLAVAPSLNNLAVLYLRQGRYKQAEPLFQRALQIRRQSTEASQSDVAQSLHNLALLYSFQGKYRQAEPLFQQALSISEQVLGTEHEKTAVCLQNLAEVYRQLGLHEQAKPLYQRALTLLERQAGLEHPLVTHPLAGLANLALEEGAYVQAEALYRRALTILEQQLSSDHPYAAEFFLGLADLFSAQDLYEQAQPLYRRALALLEQQLGPEYPLVALALTKWANLLLKQEVYEQAEPLYQRALRLNEQVFGVESPLLVEPLTGLATLLVAQGSFEQAHYLYQRAHTILGQQLLPEHPLAIRILEGLAGLSLAQGIPEQARSLYQQALDLHKRRRSRGSPGAARLLQILATLEESQKQMRQASSLSHPGSTEPS